MTEADFGIALLLFLIAAVFTLYVRFVPHRRERKIIQTYRLYKVRDDLVYLVAQGKLKEQDYLFQTLYPTINLFIQYKNEINLETVVKAFRNAREKKIDPVEKDNWRKIHERLQGDPEATSIVMEFCQVVLDILLASSFKVRLATRYKWSSSLLRRFYSADDPPREAYRYYLDYERAITNTA